jgi:hypothetical protein
MCGLWSLLTPRLTLIWQCILVMRVLKSRKLVMLRLERLLRELGLLHGGLLLQELLLMVLVSQQPLLRSILFLMLRDRDLLCMKILLHLPMRVLLHPLPHVRLSLELCRYALIWTDYRHLGVRIGEHMSHVLWVLSHAVLLSR